MKTTHILVLQNPLELRLSNNKKYLRNIDAIPKVKTKYPISYTHLNKQYIHDKSRELPLNEETLGFAIDQDELKSSSEDISQIANNVLNTLREKGAFSYKCRPTKYLRQYFFEEKHEEVLIQAILDATDVKYTLNSKLEYV